MCYQGFDRRPGCYMNYLYRSSSVEFPPTTLSPQLHIRDWCRRLLIVQSVSTVRRHSVHLTWEFVRCYAHGWSSSRLADASVPLLEIFQTCNMRLKECSLCALPKWHHLSHHAKQLAMHLPHILPNFCTVSPPKLGPSWAFGGQSPLWSPSEG